MYLVARPFTSYGNFYAAGDVIEDISVVRNARLKLSEGKLFFIDPLREPVMIQKVNKVAYVAGLDANELLIKTGLVTPKVQPTPMAPANSINRMASAPANTVNRMTGAPKESGIPKSINANKPLVK